MIKMPLTSCYSTLKKVLASLLEGVTSETLKKTLSPCNDFNQYCKVEFSIGLNKRMLNPCFRVVGTCNGLVFLADDLGNYTDNFVIWNPSIRKYVTLPKPSFRFSKLSWVSMMLLLVWVMMLLVMTIKVVRLTTLLDQVYSLAKGSWGTPCVLSSCAVLGSWDQAFVNGALHLLALRWMDDHFNCFVVAFDVVSESYRAIMLPKSFQLQRSMELRLSILGDRKSIALFVRCKSEFYYFLEIWVMKEYGVEKSWTKLMSLSPQGPNRSLPEALWFRRSGEVVLVLEDSRELVSLDIVSKQLRHLGISGGQVGSVDSYEESLVLLDRKDAVSY